MAKKRSRIRLNPIFQLTVGFLLTAFSVHGQLKFSGQGRTVMQSQRLSGEALSADSVSDRQTTVGYTLVDLRTQYTLKDKFRVLVDARVKNTFGGFGGVGIDLTLRQVRVEGLVSRFLKYSLGDVDVKLSPFTFWNSAPTDSLSEGRLFGIRRNVVQYENFNVDNHWRMRGAKFQSSINISSFGQLRILAFGVTDRATRSFNGSFPKRIGGSLVYAGRILKLEGNAVRSQEPTAEGYAKINVTSGALRMDRDFLRFRVKAELEAGRSQSNWSPSDEMMNTNRSDYFVHSEVKVSLMSGLAFGAAYNEVGPYFESPGAQTLRISGNSSSQFFSRIGNGQTIRNQGMLDRLGSESIYNQSLSAFRQVFLPQYALVLPYGDATPNRRGYSGSLSYEPGNMFGFQVKNAMYQEIFGEGNTALREFSLSNALVWVHLNNAYNSSRKLEFYGHYRRETSKRGGSLPTDLKVNAWEAGGTWEVVPNLDLLFGFKWMEILGREVKNNINTYNEIGSYSPYTIVQTETLAATGMQFHFTNRCFLLVSAYFNRVESTKELSTWNLNQIYTNFSYEF